MNSTTAAVKKYDSEYLEELGLILTVRGAYGNESDVVVGSPGTGLADKVRRLHTGSVILYETPMATFDIRVLNQTSEKVNFLITKLIPNFSVTSAFLSTEPDNTKFSVTEIEKIAASIEEVKQNLTRNNEILPEQAALIHKKLDDIKEASTRLGRKDWVNYATGLLTSTCVSAAFTPQASAIIFSAMNTTFNWLFTTSTVLLN
jgi:hypothetical protein